MMMLILKTDMHHDQDCRLVQAGRHWEGSEVILKVEDLDDSGP